MIRKQTTTNSSDCNQTPKAQLPDDILIGVPFTDFPSHPFRVTDYAAIMRATDFLINVR